ncbi:MAG: LamG-like jellyroll fold domain-containing protein [Bacteroidia bacterium]
MGSIIDNNLLSFTNINYTISYWAKINSTINTGCGIICKYGITTDFEYASVLYNTDQIVFGISNLGGTCNPLQGSCVTTSLYNNWHHFAYVANASNGSKTYVDGILVNTGVYNSSCSTGNGAGNLYFGMGGGWNQQIYYNGLIDDIGFWNRALTQTEITALYLGTQTSIQDTIVIPDTVSHISNTIEIPVRNTTTLTTSNNVISYQFNVTYNAAKLQYLSSNLIGTIASGGNVTVNSSTSGKLIISYMKSTPILGKGNILKLNFQPLQIGTSQLSISNFLYNTDTIFNTHTGNYSAIGLYGDIDTNTHVQAYDAALALQYSVGLNPLPITAPRPWTNWRYLVANVDGTDTITANDASLILQYSAGLITTFPVGSKSLENPIAFISITQENNELVFKSTGDLFGLNISTINGFNVTLSTPTAINANMLSAFNIAGSTYKIGLCAAIAPINNSTIMRIPFTCNASDTLSFNMYINKNAVVQKIYVDNSLGIREINNQTVYIYPNPANSQINVQINTNLLGSTYTITDQIGKVVLSGKLNAEKSTIELGNLSGGIYLFSIGNNAKQTFKIIKK